MEPLFSIITPSNSLPWLKKAAPSVLNQVEQSWEWVILLNATSSKPDEVHRELGGDPRIKIFQRDSGGNVGMLKRKACAYASGRYLVELDHDDELSLDCLTELRRGFEHTSKPVFVFSDCASVTAEGAPYTYGPAYGWTYHQDVFHGAADETLLVPDHPPILPQNVAKIYHAPNHVRAWTREAYEKVGGHDETLEVCDDLDLMCKLYVAGSYLHIPRVLYKYRVHGDNTWLKNQAKIDELNWKIYDRSIETMALTHSRRCGLEALDLGGGINSPVGWTSVDVHSAMVNADLNQRWPWEDSSVGVLRAQDFVEHVKDQIHVMNEAYRVLAHGGLFIIEVPSTDGRGAFQDPSHISFWNRNSFFYYTTSATQKYIKHLGINCRFQQVRILDYYPSEWHKLHHILYTKSHLAAIKDGPRLHGLIEI